MTPQDYLTLFIACVGAIVLLNSFNALKKKKNNSCSLGVPRTTIKASDSPPPISGVEMYEVRQRKAIDFHYWIADEMRTEWLEDITIDELLEEYAAYLKKNSLKDSQE